MSEHDEQKALFEWADRMVAQGRLPELVNMFAIPNGAWTKNQAMAVKLKQEGLKKGVPDIFLAVPRFYGLPRKPVSHPENLRIIHCGLFIEMKYGIGRQSKDQRNWQTLLTNSDYCYKVCFSWIDAAREIIQYLGKDPSAFADVLG
jgi:hypothetical protein